MMPTTDGMQQPATAAAGTLIADRYRILDRIGRGGLADVYRATDEALGREVALKIFRPEFASAADLRRQQDEVRILATRSHPSLVTLFDAISAADGRAVLVLEYVKGTDVRARLRSGAITAPAVAAIGADIARALAYLHGAGVVHRDVSPANVLLPESTASGVAAKLTDLGIARLVDDAKVTATGTVIGTASYLSPEQASGRPLTPATDVYSLGLVLLECLTGRREFPGTAVESATGRLSRDPVIPEALGGAWAELLRAMTARDPAQRPTAGEAAVQLSALLAEEAPTAVLAAPEEVPTAPLAARDVTTTLPPTLLLPTPAAPEADADEPSRSGRATTTGRRRTLAIILAVDAVAAVVAVILTIGALTGSAQPSPDPVGSYPAVGGTLGTHLKQLEHQVSTSYAP
ncbi:serine/threonine-protein kinase [Leifsonia sp. TF02-11]|uniref:serine/threonine-protein kinase n=1 Tax=Leifsonia sp. TF02-11 TaxID=2815212 RepID=UPI001FB78EC8|nr:serine/threonine-protein kinase [Leifsonia sp. TF02-11]